MTLQNSSKWIIEKVSLKKSSVLDIAKKLSDQNEVDSDGNVVPNFYRSHEFDKTMCTTEKGKKLYLIFLVHYRQLEVKLI